MQAGVDEPSSPAACISVSLSPDKRGDKVCVHRRTLSRSIFVAVPDFIRVDPVTASGCAGKMHRARKQFRNYKQGNVHKLLHGRRSITVAAGNRNISQRWDQKRSFIWLAAVYFLQAFNLSYVTKGILTDQTRTISILFNTNTYADDGIQDERFVWLWSHIRHAACNCTKWNPEERKYSQLLSANIQNHIFPFFFHQHTTLIRKNSTDGNAG